MSGDVSASSDELDQYFDDDYTTEEKPEAQEVPHYQAADVTSKISNRMKIVRRDGSAIYLPYQHIQQHIITAQQDMLTLICSSIVITLEGQNLETLADQIQEEKVKAITCFNPARHSPAPANAPCITAITEQSPSEFAAG